MQGTELPCTQGQEAGPHLRPIMVPTLKSKSASTAAGCTVLHWLWTGRAPNHAGGTKRRALLAALQPLNCRQGPRVTTMRSEAPDLELIWMTRCLI